MALASGLAVEPNCEVSSGLCNFGNPVMYEADLKYRVDFSCELEPISVKTSMQSSLSPVSSVSLALKSP